jgi:hypothetical protein
LLVQRLGVIGIFAILKDHIEPHVWFW